MLLLEALSWGLLRSLKFAKFKEKKYFVFRFFRFFPGTGTDEKKNMGRFVWNGNGREKKTWVVLYGASQNPNLTILIFVV